MLMPVLLGAVPNGAIRGRVYYDTLASPSSAVRNSRRRSAALAGLTVSLYTADGQTLLAQQVTDSAGAYTFSYLPDAGYQLNMDLNDAAMPDGKYARVSQPLTLLIAAGVPVTADLALYPIKQTRYAIADGDWQNTAIWNGNRRPGFMDDVFANAKQVTISRAVTVDKLSNSSASDAIEGGGEFRVAAGQAVTVDYLEHGASTGQPCVRNADPLGYLNLRVYAYSYAKAVTVAKGVNYDAAVVVMPIITEGYSVAPTSQTNETEMESGLVRTRRVRTTAYDTVSVTWLLSHEQFLVWRVWFRDNLNAGERWTKLRLFTGEDPDAIDCSSLPLRICKFKGGQGKNPFTANQEGQYWKVKAELWVLPEALNV